MLGCWELQMLVEISFLMFFCAKKAIKKLEQARELMQNSAKNMFGPKRWLRVVLSCGLYICKITSTTQPTPTWRSIDQS